MILISVYLAIVKIRFLEKKSFNLGMMILLLISYCSLICLQTDNLVFCKYVDQTYQGDVSPFTDGTPYDELTKTFMTQCKINNWFTSICMFCIVLVQSVFVIKYWMLTRKIEWILYNRNDHHLEFKAKLIFTVIMLLTIASIITTLVLSCNY